MTSDFSSKIRPYPRTPVYPTTWAGMQTFEQIYDNLAFYASNVMKNYAIRPHELPDCLQIGFMVLWETLTQQPDFLAQKTRRQAVFFVLARCRISSLRYGEGRYDRLDELISDDWHDTADEHAITGLEANRDERWAAWATDVDLRVDIERIMVKLAEKYADSFQHLVALYFITTQVTRADAAKIAGPEPFRWYKSYVLPLLVEVQFEFAQVFREGRGCELPGEVVLAAKKSKCGGFTAPYREWRESYQQGNVAPADKLLAQYAHTPFLVQALRAQLDGETYQEAAEHYGRNFHGFKRHMKRAARLLKEAYAA
jgi:DNA-directed RNA polymerase specialized sigma24 family protein